MIFTWVLIIILALTGLGVAGILIWMIMKDGSKLAIAGLITTIILTVAICGGIVWWLYNTEGGKRAIKDTKSNISGGIERIVTIYDVNGKKIKEYSGKFDVEYDSERIKFDDEKGKRHMIYYTTGTVTIDEQ